MFKSNLIRLSLATLAVLGATVPLILWGVDRAMQGAENTPILWVPASFPQRRDLEWFKNAFGFRDIIVVSWEGCTVHDERLGRFEKALESPNTLFEGHRATDFFREVHTGYSSIQRLMAPPLELSRDEAVNRLKGSLVGPDGEKSCAVVSVYLYSADQRATIRDFLLDVAQRQVGLPRDQIYLGGSVIDGAAIDAESSRSNLFAIPSAILSLLLCRYCLKSWRLTLPVIIVAAFGEGLMIAMVYFTGATMNAVLAVMSPLVFVLTVSAGVHLVNYYHDEVRLRGAGGATGRAIAAGWMPCLVAAITTAIGLGSLMVSDVIPVKQFGGLSAVGVMITLGLLFLTVPGAMTWFSLSRAAGESQSSSPPAQDRSPPAAADSPDVPEGRGFEEGVASFVCRRKGWISAICILLMSLAACGLVNVQTSVSVRSLLVAESRTIQDYQWLESHLGPLTPVEIVVHFESLCGLDALERLELVKQVQHEINQVDGIDGATSLATFFPDIPAMSWRPAAVARRTVLRRELEESRQQLVDTGWLHATQQRESWRIGARVNALGNVDYSHALNALRARVEPVLAAHPASGLSATYTGIMPVVDAAQRALLNDMFNSFLTALVLVAIVMILVLFAGATGLVTMLPRIFPALLLLLRAAAAGMLAMLPNIFPAVVLFGGLGWLGISIDIGTVMTASVALGIAVDDTIHFLTWFRRELKEGRSTDEAVRRSFKHCARAMLHTTVICGVGLLIFTWSEFLPTRRFAWMMFTLLMAALVGDLLLLPALLAGPFGRMFYLGLNVKSLKATSQTLAPELIAESSDRQ